MVAVRFCLATALHSQATACGLLRPMPGPAFKYFSAVASSSEPLCSGAIALELAAAGIIAGPKRDLNPRSFSALWLGCFCFCGKGAVAGRAGGESFAGFGRVVAGSPDFAGAPGLVFPEGGGGGFG